MYVKGITAFVSQIVCKPSHLHLENFKNGSVDVTENTPTVYIRHLFLINKRSGIFFNNTD